MGKCVLQDGSQEMQESRLKNKLEEQCSVFTQMFTSISLNSNSNLHFMLN
jgi:hypothetical protein